MLLKRALAAVSIWAVLAVVAEAAPPHKALIVTGQNGHDWKGTTPVLKKLLEETGLFAVDVAVSPAKGEDMSGFKPKFADYDLVVSNYQGDAWPEETKKAFVEYVKNGGGVVISTLPGRVPRMERIQRNHRAGGWGNRKAEAGPDVAAARRQVRARHLRSPQRRRARPLAALPDRRA